MKVKTKNILITIGTGVTFVVGLLLASYLHTPSVEITTPEQDAQLLAEKAKVIRTEDDLRNLEKLAYEYEIAYKHAYNGAMAMYFKTLVEPIIIAAGDRREKVRAREDYIANEKSKFYTTLSNVDEAWCMELGTMEEVAAQIAANNARIEELQQETMTLQARKEQLGEEAWNGPGGKLDEKCLEEIGKIEERVKQCNDTIAQLEHKNEIILLACRLQRGEEPAIISVDETIEVETAVEAETLAW